MAVSRETAESKASTILGHAITALTAQLNNWDGADSDAASTTDDHNDGGQTFVLMALWASIPYGNATLAGIRANAIRTALNASFTGQLNGVGGAVSIAQASNEVDQSRYFVYCEAIIPFE